MIIWPDRCVITDRHTSDCREKGCVGWFALRMFFFCLLTYACVRFLVIRISIADDNLAVLYYTYIGIYIYIYHLFYLTCFHHRLLNSTLFSCVKKWAFQSVHFSAPGASRKVETCWKEPGNLMTTGGGFETEGGA